MVTDYDVWHQSEQPVTVEMVVANLGANAEAGQAIVGAVAAGGLPERACGCADALRDAIITAPEAISQAARRRLGVIAARYLPDEA
jgi:5'-methylthioadenosine phosphorylase